MPLHPKYAEAERLCDEIAELAAHIAAATARWLGLLAQLERNRHWGEGYKTLPHWLAWRCGMSIGTARDHVRTAVALEQRPLIAAAFERGELSYSKVRALMRMDASFPEQALLTMAQCASASQLETIVRGCRRSVAVEDGAKRQLAERSFSWGRDEDGAYVFRGRLPAEQGALVVRALEAARDELGPPPAEITEDLGSYEREEALSHEARRADAFVAVAQTALKGHCASADVYQLVVHVDADSLREETAAEEVRVTLEDGEPLPSELARRLACDASVVRVIEKDGKPLSVGRRTRTVPAALRKALRIRDQGCAFPGCTQRHHTDAHHIEHWANGGATKLQNLVQLCRFHHSLIHKRLFEIRPEPGGTFTFLRANGTVVPQAPRQPRGDCASVTGENARRGISVGRDTLYPQEANPQAELWRAVDGLLSRRVVARE